MSEVQKIIDRCRKRNGGQVSLRELWPGRGALPTKIRANAKKLFGDRQEVKEMQMVKKTEIVEGKPKEVEVEESVVIATIVFDKPRGVYLLAS